MKIFMFVFIIGASSVFFIDDAIKYFLPDKNGIPSAKLSSHIASATLVDFYKSLDKADCAKAIDIRPEYTLERCKKVSKVTINDVQLKTLSENTATVYIDVSYRETGLDVDSQFVGTVELGNKNGKWFIAENFVSASESEQAPQIDSDAVTQSKNIVTKLEVGDGKKIPVDLESSDFLLGKFEPYSKKSFSKIDSRYSSRDGMYMNADAYLSFKKMHQAAAKEGVDLVIMSAARNFSYQKGIWEGKWTGSRTVDGKNLSKSIPDSLKRSYKILENSSMPGSSRHHWGTDIDLNAFDNSYFTRGKGKKEYEWLRKNAKKYGFCQPYSSKTSEKRTGYNEEMWHWSYLPLSKKYFNQSKNQLKNEMLSGFLGSETAVKIDVVGQYVLGISANCH